MMLTSCLICFYRACYKLRLHVSSWRWVTSNWKSELNSIPQSTQMLPRVICSPVNSVSTICNGWTLTLQSLVHVREKVVYRNGYMKFILTYYSGFTWNINWKYTGGSGSNTRTSQNTTTVLETWKMLDNEVLSEISSTARVWSHSVTLYPPACQCFGCCSMFSIFGALQIINKQLVNDKARLALLSFVYSGILLLHVSLWLLVLKLSDYVKISYSNL